MNTIHSHAHWPGRIHPLLWLLVLVLVPVLLNGCKSPITNTNTITIGNIGTNAVASMPTNPPPPFSTDMLDSVSHLVNDINGLVTDVKSIKESQVKNASEALTIETIEIIIVISAMGIFIYVRKIKRDLSEEIRRANEGALGKPPFDKEPMSKKEEKDLPAQAEKESESATTAERQERLKKYAKEHPIKLKNESESEKKDEP